MLEEPTHPSPPRRAPRRRVNGSNGESPHADARVAVSRVGKNSAGTKVFGKIAVFGARVKTTTI
jgi:hypothetical protein